MRGLFFILLVTPFLAFGQVKEVNFLGKSWYLHGYDFRIMPRFYLDSYLEEVVNNAEFPNEDYKAECVDSILFTVGDLHSQLLNLSIGFVFRPFHQTDIKLIRKVEFSQNLNFGYLDQDAFYHSRNGQMEDRVKLRSFQIGYNPRIMISSPTFADYLKLYIIGEGFLELPISSTIYTQVYPSLLLNSSSGYTNGDVDYTDRLSSQH